MVVVLPPTLIPFLVGLPIERVADSIRTLDCQLCPIPTEYHWSIGGNQRSHLYFHKAFNKLLAKPVFDSGHNRTRLLAEVETAWNCTQYTNRILPHLHRFGVIPRALGELDTSLTTQECIPLMELLRVETDQLRAKQLSKGGLQFFRGHVTGLRHFTIDPNVCFCRRKFGWRQVSAARIDHPTSYFSFGDNVFTTDENRIRPYLANCPSHQRYGPKNHKMHH